MNYSQVVLYACVTFLFASQINAQSINNNDFDRSQISIMVIPYTSIGEDILSKIENDIGYKTAISEINSILLKLGYRNTKDFKTHRENIKNKGLISRGMTKGDKMKIYIQNAPVDVIVQAEIIWTDPPKSPRNRQVQIILKAVDKYTSFIYANSASIDSKRREFPNLKKAINITLKSDGKDALNDFLDQLDNSYYNTLVEGRQINIKFEIDLNSDLTLQDRVGSTRLSDRIEECIIKNAFNGNYKFIGEEKYYMDFAVRVPVVDSVGNSISPNIYIRRKVDDYFYDLGYEVNYSVIGTWISFILIKKINQGKSIPDTGNK